MKDREKLKDFSLRIRRVDMSLTAMVKIPAGADLERVDETFGFP